MTTADFGESNRDLNKRLVAQMSKMINAQFADLQMPSPPAVEAIRKQMVGIASMNQLNDRLREITATSMPELPKIQIAMPRIDYLNEFSTRYGRMLFDMTDVGRRFDLNTVQSVVQGVENGSVTLDEDAVAEQNPEILGTIDDELETILEGNAQTLTPAQRVVLRRSLLVLYLIMMACIFYVANTQLPPEFLDWFNSIAQALGFAGTAHTLVKWADSDDKKPR